MNHTEQVPKCMRTECQDAKDLLLECFIQACSYDDKKNPQFKYDHMCMSTYEGTQDYLIEHGMIKKEECCRK